MPTNAEPKQTIKIIPKEDIPEPVQYHVIYVNDEVTTMEFVVETLVVVFNYDHITAQDITSLIHEEGSAVVATLPYEMAEQKGVEVTLLARNNGFPLAVKLEPAI